MQKQDYQNLRECPFCGGEAFLRKLYTNYIIDAAHKENCPMMYLVLPYDSQWVTRMAASAAWNLRRGDNTGELLKNPPRSEQQQVIHCRDCKHYYPLEYGIGRCNRNSVLSLNGKFYLSTYSAMEDEYCSRGERKDAIETKSMP